MREKRRTTIPWPWFSRGALFVGGILFLLLAALAMWIASGRVYARKEVEKKKVNEAAMVAPSPSATPTPSPSPSPKAMRELPPIPVPVSICFNPELDLTVSEVKVARGAIVRLATPGVSGGMNYGDVNYSWTASAGAITHDGKTAKLDTSGIETNTKIQVRVEAIGKGGQCKASSRGTTIQATVPYTPPTVSLELGRITSADPNIKWGADNLLCAGDKIRLRAAASLANAQYEWRSTSERILGEGAEATLDTTSLRPGIYTVMVWARAGEEVAFDSKLVIVAPCTQEAMQLSECPLPPGPAITINSQVSPYGVIFSLPDIPFPPGKVRFEWKVDEGKIHGSGGVVWFDEKSAPFVSMIKVELTVTGEKEGCRVTGRDTAFTGRLLAMAAAGRPSSCTFQRNSAALDSDCKSELREMAGELRKERGSRAYIDVYRLPGEIEGLELLRGKTIFDYLVKTHKIDPHRIIIRTGGVEKSSGDKDKTVDVELQAAEAGEPAPDGPAVVFFSAEEPAEAAPGAHAIVAPPLQYQEEVKGDYPSGMELGEEEVVSLRFVRKLTTTPTSTKTTVDQGDRTTTTQPVAPIPGRDLEVPLEAAMGEEYEPWIRASLSSSTFETAPKSAEMADWRKLNEAGEVLWEWTIRAKTPERSQELKAEIEIEWRRRDGKGQPIKQPLRHRLWEDILRVAVDNPIVKQRQLKTATPVLSLTGLALIVAGAFPRRRREEDEEDEAEAIDKPAPLILPTSIPPAPESAPGSGGRRRGRPVSAPPSAPPAKSPEAPPMPEPAGATPPAPAPDVVMVRAGGEDDASNAQQDLVECSVFAPPAAARGVTLMVQVFAHLREQAEEAARMAAEFDEEARRRAVKTLSSKIARGSALMFDLTIANWELADPVQSLTWNGNAESVQFFVDVPPNCKPGNVPCKLTVSQNSVPLGHISFMLKVAESADATPQLESAPAGESAKRYSYAFVSYASADRSEVIERVQMLETMGIKYFQDVLSLDPGDRWEKKLYENIDKCDLFLLFWSHAAKESPWVMKEVEYAIARKHGNDDTPPEIKPVIIEGPPLVPPPENLKQLHFNDRLLYFR